MVINIPFQNSIRHNLSLNKKWFVKFDRRPTQAHPGKGGYWTLQVNMEKIFVDNLSQAGGHSRRHHDMGMYASLSTQYYRTPSEDSDELFDDESNINAMCPNILITVPADYEVKKTKSTNHVVSAPRIRNMTSQEKNLLTPTTAVTPKTDPKNFIIRFNPSSSSDLKRRKTTDPPRPAPKAGKKHNPVEPGSSTAEEDRQDSAVELDMDEHLSKRRKSTTTNLDTITASPSFHDVSYNGQSLVRPEDVIGTMNFNNNDFWMFGEPEVPATNNLLLTSEYSLFYDNETQNLLNGLQSSAYAPTTTQNTDMKTVDLQFSAFDKTIHYPNMFDADQFADINSQMFIPELSSYNMEQYIDMSIMEDTQPSDLLLDDESTMMNSYWNDTSSCYLNFDVSNPMPFVVKQEN